MKNFIFILGFFSVNLLFADQQQLISRDIAEKAKLLIIQNPFLLEFVQPAKENCFQNQYFGKIDPKDIKIEGSKRSCEISIKGKKIDLAYTFFSNSENGVFLNLAKELNLSATDTPKALTLCEYYQRQNKLLTDYIDKQNKELESTKAKLVECQKKLAAKMLQDANKALCP